MSDETPKRLYRVNVNFDIYVVADDPEDAVHSAQEAADDEMCNGNADFHPIVLSAVQQVPVEARDSIPYGTDDDRTVAEILTQGDQ